ncbi:unnamed protein product [Brassica oleracea var. botrytis]
MVNQASQSSVHAGLKAWVHNLLPLLLVDNSQKTHQWTELILDIVEKILAKPGTLEELVGSPSWESHVVIPITSLKTMLRVRFPATEEEWLLPVHNDAWIALSKNPGVAREAIAIAIWYLRTNI